MNIWNFAVKAIMVPFNAISKIIELFFEKFFEPFWSYIAYKHFKVTMSILVCVGVWMSYRLIFG